MTQPRLSKSVRNCALIAEFALGILVTMAPTETNLNLNWIDDKELRTYAALGKQAKTR